ncbi:hypothetical protein WA158_005177 [Blastocystis sp. Blastoise]
MKVPNIGGVFRLTQLQLKTGFITQRPAFYDPLRLNPPLTMYRVKGSLRELDVEPRRLMKFFMKKYPYHFEDFTNQYAQSSQVIASRFVKKQIKLMNEGLSEKEAFQKVEKEFLREMDILSGKLTPKPVPKEENPVTEEGIKDNNIASMENTVLNTNETTSKTETKPEKPLPSLAERWIEERDRLDIGIQLTRVIEDYKKTAPQGDLQRRLQTIINQHVDEPKL